MAIAPATIFSADEKTLRPLKILVLGGTNFVGPAFVEKAQSLGHEVTLFNRGITRPYLFPETEKLRGDRRLGLEGLSELGSERTWDAVIDVWPADAGMVEASARCLADRTNYYFFVSSIGVYRSYRNPGMDETAALRLGDEGYAGEKGRCEKIVAELFPDRHGIARCHSIFGPYDPGSSLHYWLRTIGTGKQVIAPGPGDDLVQFVDVRDLANWTLDSVSSHRVGIFNIAGKPIKFKALIDSCRRVTSSDALIKWLSPEWLLSKNVGVFTELPLWIPLAHDPEPGFFQISAEKAFDAGLVTRPVDQTLAAAWLWYQSAFFADTVFPLNGWGMNHERQAELLANWSKQDSPNQ